MVENEEEIFAWIERLKNHEKPLTQEAPLQYGGKTTIKDSWNALQVQDFPQSLNGPARGDIPMLFF